MLKVGLIGYGEKTDLLIYTLLGMNDYFCFVGVSEVSSIKKYDGQIKQFSTVQDLISDVDCLIIVSNSDNHYDLTSYALRRGKHVFIESPVAYSVGEAKKISSLAYESGVKVQIGCESLFNSGFSLVGDYIQRPFLIDTTHKISNKHSLKNLIYDWMTNDIQVALDLVKSGVKRISSNALGVYSNWIDLVNVRIEFDNGCVATIKLDATSESDSLQTYIYQKGLKVHIDFDENTSKVIYPDKILDLKSKEDSAKHQELLSFYQAIVHDMSTRVTVEHSIDALVLANKIEEHIKLLNPIISI